MKGYRLVLLSGLLSMIACGDQEIEDVANPSTSGSSDVEGEDSAPTSPPVDYIEPVAVGFELFTGWDQETGELLGWTLDDGSEQPPYVAITLASADFFYGTDAAESTCQMYAWFVVDPMADLLQAEGYNWPGGPGGSGNVAALWGNASFEGYLEIFAENSDTNCTSVDPSVFPTGNYMDSFNYMHFGIGFSDLSSYTEEWLSSAWDLDGNGSLSAEEEATWMMDKTSFMSQYIAVNHPNSAEPDGYDFIGYDWNYGRGFEFDLEEQKIVTEECAGDPSQQCFVPADMQSNQGSNAVYIMSGARWYEDLPYLNLSLMQENNGLPSN